MTSSQTEVVHDNDPPITRHIATQQEVIVAYLLGKSTWDDEARVMDDEQSASDMLQDHPAEIPIA